MGKQRNRFVGKAKKTNGKMSVKKFQGLRYAIEEGEIYAIVTKIYGGAQCEVICTDGVIRRCIVRGKFRGKQKRHNLIEIGTWVLVGVRDWGNSSDTKQLCDLLTVYSSNEKETLKKSGKDDFSKLISNHLSQNNSDDITDNTVFIEQDEISEELESLISKEAAANNVSSTSENVEDIFVDDI